MTDAVVCLRRALAVAHQLLDYGEQRKHIRAILSAVSVGLARRSSLPAAIPAVELTRCLTRFPASATMSFVVTLAASSPAGRGSAETCGSASSRAGTSPDSRGDRTCRAFSDHPLSTTREGGRKTLHASVQTEISGPARRADQNRVQVRSRSAVLQRVDGTGDSSAVRC